MTLPWLEGVFSSTASGKWGRTHVFSIGEFSKITGLTVKTLRFYHEQGLLVPTHVDEQTGYRYYGESKVEAARVIMQLRALDFPLDDIQLILSSYEDEADILDHLQGQKQKVREKLREYGQISKALDQIIRREREVRAAMSEATFDPQEKTLHAMLIAGLRMHGRYSECGKGFAQIGRRFGRQICGAPLLLHYDAEYKEDDADFEVCLPIRKGTARDGIAVRELAGGRCVCLLHKGPYDELGRSYARILEYVSGKGYRIAVPTREVYLKGPGMIFRGNPKKYLTEIQMLLEE